VAWAWAWRGSFGLCTALNAPPSKTSRIPAVTADTESEGLGLLSVGSDGDATRVMGLGGVVGGGRIDIGDGEWSLEEKDWEGEGGL